uniref:Uncharacterized protein n=1 Tax=Lactuca sativa TaxID=4236 RepID=A0A9R1VCS3_LACSA|nr:hypothetical protein LSAT_V11C600335870 [Lactuca sativa]
MKKTLQTFSFTRITLGGQTLIVRQTSKLTLTLVYLRGDCLYKMFTIVAMHENNRVYIILSSFCMGVTNHVDSCTWFLMRLNEAFSNAREVLFITNIYDVITSSLGHVFHDSYHEYYCKNVAIHVHRRVGRNRTFKKTFCRLTLTICEVLTNIDNAK